MGFPDQDRANAQRVQVMADIQRELELNKAEETKTREVMEQLVRRRDSGGEPAGQSTSHGMVQVSKLDDLGLKNASLLSKMSAATASLRLTFALALCVLLGLRQDNQSGAGRTTAVQLGAGAGKG